MIDTYFAITLPFIATPLSIFFMRQFMGQLPDSIIEAAHMDGAGHFRTCWQVVMPNVKPAWITLIIFAFTAAWQITGWSFIFNEALKPLPTVLQQIQLSGIARAGVGAAATVFLMTPPMVLFLFCQTNVLETMAHSGLKE
jgi:ABC-type glycerol-3-phosphate transport system permease component